MTWGVVLDPPEADTIRNRTMLDINRGPIRIDQAGIDWGDAALTQFMAEQGRVGAAPVDYTIPNRTIVIPLAVFTDENTGVTYDQAKRQLSTKVARIAQEGGVLRRTTDTGAYSPTYADIVDAVLNFPDVYGETGQFENNIRLTLTALPDFYGSEIILDQVSTTGDIAWVLKLNAGNAVILGDYPGRCRIGMTDTSGNDQRGIIGGFRGRYYDSAATARTTYEAETLTLASGTTSAALAGASGGSVAKFSSLPPQIWTPILTTDYTGSGGGALTHRGTYRVVARCYTSVGDQPGGNVPPVWLRFAWSVGSTIYLTLNDQIEMPASTQFFVMDLGQISIQAAPIGTHYWRGQIQAWAPAGGAARDIQIDKVWFINIDETSFQPTAPVVAVQGVNPLVAWDDFSSLGVGAVLNGRTAPLGGTWATSAIGAGGSTTDFVGSVGGGVQRSTVSDGTVGYLSGRLALFSTVFTDTEVGGDWLTTSFPHGPNNSGGLGDAVIARYTNASNYMSLGYFYYYGMPFFGLFVVAAGVFTNVASVRIVELVNTWVTIDCKVFANGQVYGAISLQGQSQSPLWTVSGYHAALATGGTLASGQAGFVDSNTYTGAATRSFDNVFARNPVTPSREAVLFGFRSCELRSDGFFRYDSGGVAASPMPRRQGDYPRIPVSGIENRNIELMLMTSRGDFQQVADGGLDSFAVQVRYRPCWLLGQ